MKTTCRNRITTWCMMGFLVVGLNVWFALPARAVPIDYSLEGGAAVGGFTLDATQAAPYISWNFTAAGLNFNNLDAGVVQINRIVQPDVRFDLVTVTHGDIQLRFETLFFPSLTRYELSLFSGYPRCIGCQFFGEIGTVTPTAVPEPSLGVFLLIGLLVLAGARWWTHRQERLQLG